jgi:hypothetical protein
MGLQLLSISFAERFLCSAGLKPAWGSCGLSDVVERADNDRSDPLHHDRRAARARQEMRMRLDVGSTKATKVIG